VLSHPRRGGFFFANTTFECKTAAFALRLSEPRPALQGLGLHTASSHTYAHVRVARKSDTRPKQEIDVYRRVVKNVEIFLDYKHMLYAMSNTTRSRQEEPMSVCAGLVSPHHERAISEQDARIPCLSYTAC